MPIFQINSEIILFATYVNSAGEGVTGLNDVTCDVWRITPTGNTLMVNSGTAIEVGNGIYSYSIPAGANTVQSVLVAVFKTASTSVSQKHIFQGYPVGYWAEKIDVPVSSRLPSGGIVQAVAPVSTGGDVNIFKGGVYNVAYGNALVWEIDTPTDYRTGNVALKIDGGVSAAGIIDAISTATRLVVKFGLSEAQTTTLGVGRYRYSVSISFPPYSGSIVLATGTVIVTPLP